VPEKKISISDTYNIDSSELTGQEEVDAMDLSTTGL